MKLRTIMATLAAAALLPLSGLHCGNDQGPAEEAGEEVDETIKEGQDELEQRQQ